MQKLVFFVPVLIVCAIVLCAGCVSSPGAQGNTSSTQVTVTTTNMIALSPLSFTLADLPANYTQVSGRQKSISELGQDAQNLGWEEGYVAMYSLPGNGTSGPTLITQTITVYPTVNIPKIVTIANSIDRQGTELIYTDLPMPNTGPETYTFSATPKVNTVPTGNNALGPFSSSTSTSVPPQGYIETIFGKGNILEVIRMSGPDAQYSTLKSLAETAYNKFE